MCALELSAIMYAQYDAPACNVISLSSGSGMIYAAPLAATLRFSAVFTVVCDTSASADPQVRLLCHRQVSQRCAQITFELRAKQQGATALRSPPRQQRTERLLRCAAAASGVDIGTLQSKFGIPEHVEVTTGEGGLPIVRLTHSCGASAEVKLRPASWFCSPFFCSEEPTVLVEPQVPWAAAGNCGESTPCSTRGP